MSNPLDDESRWLMGSRFDVPDFIRSTMKGMFNGMVQDIPVDDPLRTFWDSLPKAPGWE